MGAEDCDTRCGGRLCQIGIERCQGQACIAGLNPDEVRTKTGIARRFIISGNPGDDNYGITTLKGSEVLSVKPHFEPRKPRDVGSRWWRMAAGSVVIDLDVLEEMVMPLLVGHQVPAGDSLGQSCCRSWTPARRQRRRTPHHIKDEDQELLDPIEGVGEAA